MDQDHNKIVLALILFFGLVGCSPKPEEAIIKLIEEKYANMYVNNEPHKREVLRQLSEYLKTHSLADENLDTIHTYLNKMQDGHLVLLDNRAEKNAHYVSQLKYFPGSFSVASCADCDPVITSGKYEIMEVNNLSMRRFLQEEEYSVAASTPWGRNYRISRLLQERAVPTDILLKLRDHSGKMLTSKLTWQKVTPTAQVCVSGERLNENLFKLNIYSLWCDDITKGGLSREGVLENFKKQFDETMAHAKESDKIIIDLRENGGGGDAEVEYVLNAFFENPVQMYRYKFLRSTHPGAKKWLEKISPFNLSLWSPEELQFSNIVNRPKKTFFKNKLATMISAGCFSSCEGISAALKHDKRSLLIGETTHGGAGEPIIFPIKGTPYSINLTACIVWQKNNELFEGHGVKPDLVSVQDPRTLSDNVLQQAIDQAL